MVSLIKFQQMVFSHVLKSLGFPGGSDGKESACHVGDLGSIHGSGRSPGGGLGNPLQYSCLEHPLDRGAWWAVAHGVPRVGETEEQAEHGSRSSRFGGRREAPAPFHPESQLCEGSETKTPRGPRLSTPSGLTQPALLSTALPRW